MALRDFVGIGGRLWTAWEVHPRLAERMLGPSGNSMEAASPHHAWLAFESHGPAERRRLWPVPSGWNELPDEDLATLCEQAQIVPPRRPPIE